MGMRGAADIDQVNVRVGQEVFEPGISLDPLELHLLALGSKVAANAAPVPGPLLGIAAANRRHGRAFDLLGAQVVDHAHKSHAYYADPHHFRSSFPICSLRLCPVFLIRPFCTTFTPTLAPILAPGRPSRRAGSSWPRG